jgi:2-dehydropantoate 2-reductase
MMRRRRRSRGRSGRISGRCRPAGIDGRRVGAHRTSMLQDLDKGRPLELDALLTVVREMGRLVDVATPTIDVVLGLAQQMGRVRGVYPVFAEAVVDGGADDVRLD